MWDKLLSVLRDWSILLIGLILILGGFSFGTVWYQPGAQTSSLAQSAPAPQAKQNAEQNAPAPQKQNASAAQDNNPPPEPQKTAAAAPAPPPSPQSPPPGPANAAPTPAASPEPPANAPAQGSTEHNHTAQATQAAAPAEGATQGQAPAPSPTPAPSPAANVAAAGGAPSAGDAGAGRLVFRKCQACHSLEPGKNILGPSLAGVIGRKAGTEPNFNYSPAMKQAELTWDAKTLDQYLTDPAKLVPGNKMPFPGLKTDHDRADVIAYLAAASGGAPAAAAPQPTPAPQAAAPAPQPTPSPQATPAPQAPAAATATPPAQAPQTGYIPDATYTLRSGIAEGRMVYIGVGGAIDGKVNPVLTAAEGQVVQLTLINGEGAEHDIVFPDQGSKSPRVTGKGASATIAFQPTKSGDFVYYCSVPGHRLAGMEGHFIVTPRLPPQAVVEADISREPTDLPPPIGKRDPQTVRVDLLSVEVEGRLAEGTTFGYWTFNGKVPGPFVRVRVGDTVDIHLKNSADSSMIHSVDFHAATGPGGGASVLQVDPGQEKSMTWKALVPGLYVYHCATPMVAEHIANGMYGLILVEPEEGLSPVDHEFYVMQGEVCSDLPFGQHGSAEFSVEKLLNERPEYFVFNGSVGALSKLHPMHANVGQTVRIFFGVGGPNYTSSFHVIGEIMDNVYFLGGIKSPPLHGIQTVPVPPGGAVIAEFKTEVPGNYTLLDHAIARTERGLLGILSVEGAPNPDIFNGQEMPAMGH